jgi:hypothetical protein
VQGQAAAQFLTAVAPASAESLAAAIKRVVEKPIS